jgi:hypothetical protein
MTVATERLSAPSASSTETSDFLHAKSMLTPGIAGAITMLITNALHQNFDAPQRWVALVLSFLLATLVFGDRRTVVWQRIVFYVLNALIIFSMAVGANSGASAITQQGGPRDSELVPESIPAETSGDAFFQDWFQTGS